jgi:spore coat protein U-like protein
MNIKLNKLALALGALVMAGSAVAATDTATMGSTASIAAECAVADGTTLAFTKLDMLNFGSATQSTVDSTIAGTFNAICTNGATAPTFTYTSLNGGTADFHLKGQTIAGETIAYTLYQSTDSLASPVTINTPISQTTFVIDGTTKSLPLSAKILASAKNGKQVQSYADTITITVNY